jgi:hypothetical protein
MNLDFFFRDYIIFWFHIFYIDIQTNQCLENNGGCWLDHNSNNFTACKVQLY